MKTPQSWMLDKVVEDLKAMGHRIGRGSEFKDFEPYIKLIGFPFPLPRITRIYSDPDSDSVLLLVLYELMKRFLQTFPGMRILVVDAEGTFISQYYLKYTGLSSLLQNLSTKDGVLMQVKSFM